MILNRLAAHYENLAEQGKLGRPGWISANVSYALEIDESGNLCAVLSLIEATADKKGKTVTRPRALTVPEQVKRSSGVAPNFLCDNSKYLLGIGKKEVSADELDEEAVKKQEKEAARVQECFQHSAELHRKLLGDCSDPAAVAICRFFEQWEPANAENNPILLPYWEEIVKAGNLTFFTEDDFAVNCPEIRQVWQEAYDKDEDDTLMYCLDTGEEAPVAILHPNIQGVRGAKSTGASLVSFNAPAYESYGKAGAQGMNAPVSKYTAFAYGEALKYLLKDFQRVRVIGDTTVVCWAESGAQEYQDLMGSFFDDEDKTGHKLSDNDLMNILDKISKGQPVDLNGIQVDPEEPFYLLGLAPNAARISVRFFLQGSFGDFARNINAHYQRLDIEGPKDMAGRRSIWFLLNETVNQNATAKVPKPHLAGDMLQAILTNGRYPETLLHGVELRIQAERTINWRRAAIIQAFLLQNRNNMTKEILQMNEEGNMSTLPGKLGQLFSLMEQAQLYSIRGSDYTKTVGRTIVDSYFTSASTTPGVVFPIIIDLNKKHMSKISKDPKLRAAAVVLDKRISKLLAEIAEEGSIPTRLSLTERGQFQLGYYFENQRRFDSTKKEDKESE